MGLFYFAKRKSSIFQVRRYEIYDPTYFVALATARQVSEAFVNAAAARLQNDCPGRCDL